MRAKCLFFFVKMVPSLHLFVIFGHNRSSLHLHVKKGRNCTLSTFLIKLAPIFLLWSFLVEKGPECIFRSKSVTNPTFGHVWAKWVFKTFVFFVMCVQNAFQTQLFSFFIQMGPKYNFFVIFGQNGYRDRPFGFFFNKRRKPIIVYI